MEPLIQRRNQFFRETPNFWLSVFLAHPIIRNLVHDESTQEVLSNLTDIRFDSLPDGFKMIFVRFPFFIIPSIRIVLFQEFSENKFFTNHTLEKTYRDLSEPLPLVETTPIAWKTGMVIVFFVYSHKMHSL